MLFKYTGYTSNGLKIKAQIEASNIEEAKLKLKSKSILYTSIKEYQNFKFLKLNFKRINSISQITLSNISRDLSIYLNSGISLIQAIDLLKQRYQNNKILGSFFEVISTYLYEGKTFNQALEIQTVIKLPEFYKQSIKISEESGLLNIVLMEMSIFFKEQSKIKNQIKQALAYPLFILIISFFMVGFMLSFVVPKITGIFTQLNQELPTSTKIVIYFGDFFQNNYYIIIILCSVSIAFFMFLLKKSYKFKFICDKFCLKIPFFSKLIEQSELSRFAYMNSILIKSGIPIVQAINLSANILKNEVIKKVFIEASKNIVEGKKLSILLANNKIYKIDEAFIHSISIGEDTSKLSQVLDNLSIIYNESNKDKTTIIMSLLEPIFMLIVGGIIGFIVFAMLLPIFSMNLG
ncbi:MAG: type II secretion system F family protein [Aliarcobacter sp.]|nr:type II secretion system F family protein [Aliarcobacter sp.]